MRVFMMNNEQTDGLGHTDGARANGMPACDDQTSLQKQTQTAGGAPLVAYNNNLAASSMPTMHMNACLQYENACSFS